MVAKFFMETYTWLKIWISGLGCLKIFDSDFWNQIQCKIVGTLQSVIESVLKNFFD